MKFCNQLNEYIELLGCTAKELGSTADLSAATLSRYRSGERVPDRSSDTFDKLCLAIASIAAQTGISEVTEDSVRESFYQTEDFSSSDSKHLMQNFDMLVSVLNINVSQLCRYINYDTSTIFRFRNGTRHPADPKKFATAIAGYVARELDSSQNLVILSNLLGYSKEELSDESIRYERLQEYLLNTQSTQTKETDISGFLTKLDEFDLNEYIKAIRFDELKVPSVPFQLPSSKTYWGLTEMMESELDFLKATVLSKSKAPVIMYSDMPMAKMAKDPDFPKEWMFGMAMLLKKGLHLHQIHNLDRSFEDMMLGLESWIPMYMTGLISPYYLKSVQNNVFLHLLKVSGTVALSGEAIAGYHSKGKYYLTNSKKEVEYYTQRANELLANAYPLMDIYRSERENELNAFLLADSSKPGRRRSILSTLPLYTMSETLLSDILNRHGISDTQQQNIQVYAAALRQRVETILNTACMEDEIPILTPEDFAENAPVLELSGAFFETDISYSYEDYLSHIKETEAFAAANPNYTVKKTASHAFCNLQIQIHEGQWAMISKGKAPAIHFVIRHPKLRNAIECFIPPVTED